MKLTALKTTITIALLAFVGISVAYAVVQEVRRAPQATAAEPARSLPPDAGGLNALKQGKKSSTVFYATYYHGNVRCPTCKKIEAYSKEGIEARFAQEIQAGKVAFRMINYDEKGNEHFFKDYNMTAQSLIVSEVKDGKEVRWKNLEKVWDLTYDKAKFIQYVEDEFRAFMKPPAKGTSVAEIQGATGTLSMAAAKPPVTQDAAGKRHVIAYYLHGNTRCPSCVKIEQYADAAVHDRFAPELESGLLEWQVVNYDDAGNQHYWDDFQLEVKTVVVAEYVDGAQVRYKRLDRVWDLLDDQQAFADYIDEEVRQYLEGA